MHKCKTYLSLACIVFSGFELSHCEDPGVPQFGFKVNDQGHFSGSTITYKCDPGYTLHGSSVLKCMTGERRAWDNPVPSCIGKKSSLDDKRIHQNMNMVRGSLTSEF